ncbi:MAG TPA: SDR family NAD(P)-dependent oxidoreductase [Polyangia bacterium]|jgi:short-subunit dehydrogenase|nr:SDR family NAD(P)-dependent oxidoreductase [Polyangia bacterium]
MSGAQQRPLAFVTGASSGIGLCYARALAARGWDLVIGGRRVERLDALARELTGAGARAETVVADLATAEGLAAHEAICRDRPLDLLVNNAAVAHYMPFAKLPADKLDELLQVNTVAVVKLARAAVEGMVTRGRGAILNVASQLAFSGAAKLPALPARVIYASTKAFLVAFSQLLAAELEGTGVKVQVVCPGVVVSEFHSRQGIDMSGRPRLPAEELVRGSLADLDAGVLVSLPTLEDPAVFDEIAAAQGKLLGQSLKPTLASRYGREGS